MSYPSRNQGMALILALVLLLVMSMLGVAGMQAAVMEQNMTSNAQQHMETFQAAESGLESTTGNDTVLGNALSAGNSGVDTSLDVSPTNGHYAGITSTNATFIGNASAVGYTLTAYTNYAFELVARATLSAGSAVSQHTSNISKLGPKI